VAYIIRATDKVGNLGWLQAVNQRGVRTIGSRDTAEVFADHASAKSVIALLPAVMAGVTLRYRIEPLTDAPDTDSGDADAP
jgi:hypothetical protein